MKVICPRCKVSGIINFETGEAICPNCAQVIIEAVSQGPGTVEGEARSTKESSGIRRITEKLNLPPNITVKATNLLSKASRNQIKKRNTRVFNAAVVYAACKIMDVPRTIQEVSSIESVSTRDVLREYRHLMLELEEKSPVGDTRKIISGLCNNLSISESTKRRSIEVYAKLADRLSPKSRNPISLACGIVYLVSVVEAENLTMNRIIKTVGISKDSVMQVVKELRSEDIFQLLLDH